MMLKQKFYKNLFQTLSTFGGICIVFIPALFGYFLSLKHGSNDGWIILVLCFSLIFLYFLIGFYWIFQKVYIDETGIKIILLRRTIKESGWEKIDTIEVATIMKNPAIRIKLTDGSEIHLDKRKRIIKIIEKYSQKKITK